MDAASVYKYTVRNQSGKSVRHCAMVSKWTHTSQLPGAMKHDALEAGFQLNFSRSVPDIIPKLLVDFPINTLVR